MYYVKKMKFLTTYLISQWKFTFRHAVIQKVKSMHGSVLEIDYIFLYSSKHR